MMKIIAAVVLGILLTAAILALPIMAMMLAPVLLVVACVLAVFVLFKLLKDG